jgi:hypothetical protein
MLSMFSKASVLMERKQGPNYSARDELLLALML